MAARAQPVPRHGGAGLSASSACAPTAREDMPSSSSTSTTPRPGALGLSVADINDTLAPPGAALHQRLPRPRPHQEGLSAGRRGFRMTPGTSTAAGTCATRRARWCRSRPSPPRTGPTARRAWSASTASRRWRTGRAARQRTVRRGDAGGRGDRPNCRPASATTGRAPRTRSAVSGSQAPALYAVSAAGGVPVPGGAVRELVGALRGDAGGAARRARRVLAASGRGLSNDVYFQVACSPPSACRRRTRS